MRAWRVAAALAAAGVAAGAGTAAVAKAASMTVGSMLPTLLTGDVTIARPAERFFSTPGEADPLAAPVMDLQGDKPRTQDGVVIVNGNDQRQGPNGIFADMKLPQDSLAAVPRCGDDPASDGGACMTDRLIGGLPDGRSHDILDRGASYLADGGEWVVRIGHVFVPGDNRDDARDGRMSTAMGGAGFVPLDAVTGTVLGASFDPRTGTMGWRALR